MIEIGMHVLLGFFLAGLVALMLAAPLWNRAVRLTTRRLEAAMPMSLVEIQADKDHMRADFAVKTRRLEMALEAAREKAARNLVERNKAQVAIEELRAANERLDTALAGRESEARVLEQALQRRLPGLQSELAQATELLESREAEMRRLADALANQSESLVQVQESAQRRLKEIEQLRQAMQGDAPAEVRLDGASGRDHGTAAAENQRLMAELSRATEEIERLKEETARDASQLKSELRLLADKIVASAQGRPAISLAQPAVDVEDAEEIEDADAALEAATTSAGNKAEPGQPVDLARRRRAPGGPPSAPASLTERLDRLAKTETG